MDLFHIKLRFGAPRPHSVRDKMDYFQCLHLLNIKSGRGLPIILLEVSNESRSTTLKSLDLSRKVGNMHSPQSSSAI